MRVHTKEVPVEREIWGRLGPSSNGSMRDGVLGQNIKYIYSNDLNFYTSFPIDL